MGYKCGIIGLPNVGKSSLFNLLTGENKAEVANYPFCTINPNEAFVKVSDKRLDKLAQHDNSLQTIYSYLKIVDIAGIVRGANKGEGLGNMFLSNILEVDLIFHVVRCFYSNNIIHVDGDVDPIRDIETIDLELRLKDIERVENKIKSVKGEQRDIFQKLLDQLLDLKAEITIIPDQFPLFSTKPRIIICNGDDINLINLVKSSVKYTVIDFNINDYEALAFMNELTPKLDELIFSGFHTLNLIQCFTSGAQEARSWQLTKGSTALDFAYEIHTDIGQKFVAATVIPWDQYLENKQPTVVGKHYIVNDGDVLYIRASR